MEIAVLNSSRSLKNIDVEFMVAACAAQLVECAQAWGIPPLAAAFYAQVASLPQGDIYVCEIVDSLDEPGALGYHADDGRPFIRIMAQGGATSITLSHEFLETLCDPTCDRWVKRADGSEVAVEVCDPVEGDYYQVSATVLGETRQVQLSNYIEGAAWFDEQGKGPFDRMGRVTKPFGMSSGGYCVVIDASGNEKEIFARVRFGSLAGAAIAGRRLAGSNSRLLRRLRGARR